MEEVWIVVSGHYRQFEGVFSSRESAVDYCEQEDIDIGGHNGALIKSVRIDDGHGIDGRPW